ncbi:MAG: hypothetical protein GXZ02_08155 [Clostridiales bacterium]|nr:hypothetical protein [Clostridiales bacterium]
MKIVFRIVTAALALCVIPAAYFLSFLKFGFSAVVMNIADDISISRAVTALTDETSPLNGLFSGSGNFFENEWVQSLMPAAISFLVFFAIAIILSLVIFFFAVFSNKRLAMTCLGGGGIIAMIGAYISFGRFAAPLMDGTISVGNLISTEDLSALLSIAVQFLGSAIKVEILQLTSATLIMTLIFAAIVIWGLAYMLTEDESEKQQRRVKKEKMKKKKKA